MIEGIIQLIIQVFGLDLLPEILDGIGEN